MKCMMNKRRTLAVLTAALIFSAACISCTSTGNAEKSSVTAPSEASATELSPSTRLAEKPREGVYYCIFVRSFADSNGDGIGDFNGITKKLDYLNDGNDKTTSDLGVTGIWLMPIFPSQTYHGYNVDDYYGVQPDYGTMADFENLVAACKKRGISVILDMTCNHSSTYTTWFQASRDKNSEYRSWYRWISADDSRYNINQKIWGHNVWNKSADGYYYSAIFDSGMPDFNLDTQAVRDEMKKIMKYWMDKGVAGFRYDAAGHVYNAAKIPTGENSLEKGVAFWKEIIDFDRSVKPDAFTVGEVWEPTSTRAAYIASLYSDFHFDMGTKIIDAINAGEDGQNNVANSLYGDYTRYKAANPEYVDAPFLSNHDQNRSAGLLRMDSAKMKLAAGMYVLAEGVPFIYYGEEIGMNGGTNDPARRSPFLWNKPGKDKLQCTWEDSLVTTYNKKAVPEAQQAKDKNSILTYYKRLIRVKTAHPALYKGRMTPLFTGNAAVSSWLMECPEEKAFVLHNLSSSAVTVALPEECIGMTLAFAASGTTVSKGQLMIPPLASVVLVK